MKNRKNLLKKIGAAIIVGIGVMVAVPMATADTGGGLGGGGSAGNLSGSVHWTSIAHNEKGQAWKEFLAMETARGRGENWVTNQVINRVNNNSVCQNSKVIWYIEHDNSGKWVYNYGDETHGSKWDNASTNKKGSTIENPSEVRGSRAPNAAEVTAFKNWDKKSNGNRINGAPGYTIICSGRFDEQVTQPPKETTETTYTYRTDDKPSYTFYEPYSYQSEIVPQLNNFVDGKSFDPIGDNNLNNQKTDVVKTNYAKAIDALTTGKSSGTDIEAIKKQLDAAIAKDAKNSTNATINLNKKNQQGMAEGGVLNVLERTAHARVELHNSERIRIEKKCTYVQTWNTSTGKYNAKKQTGCTTKEETVSNTQEITRNRGSLKNTGFWQMLSVHCNAEQFNALTNATSGSKVVQQGSVRDAIASVVYSKTYSQQPKQLDFGDKNNKTAAKSASANLGFYDKECPFNCTPSSSTSDGASNENNAVDNVNTNGPADSADPQNWGAYSKEVNGNVFEYFRDNDPEDIRVNVWYPQESGVSYDGSAAKSTTITRWAEGTPGVVDSNGGVFTMKSADGTELFTDDNDSAAAQKNWSTDPYSTTTSTQLEGQHNNFTVQATWASDANKPQQLNVKYEYAPMVNTTFPATGIGFKKGSDGSVQTLGKTATVAMPVEGKCYVNYGTEDQVNTTDSFQDNTGSGTTNNLDGDLVEGSGTDKQTNLTVRFVRATAE